MTSHSPSQMAWSEGRRPLGAVLHSSNEPSELSQLPCGLDYSTIIIIRTVVINDCNCRKSNNKCHISCHVVGPIDYLCVVYMRFRQWNQMIPFIFALHIFLSNEI